MNSNATSSVTAWKTPTQDELGMNRKTQGCAERLYFQLWLVNTVV